MTQPDDDIVELSGATREQMESGLDAMLAARPWVGVRFDCCGIYARIYRNAQATAYVGRCPRCLRSVRLRVGPEGTSARFFRAE